MDVNDAKLIDGRKLAKRLLATAEAKVTAIREATGVIPSLATVLVGDDPASVMYTHMKRRRCKEIGMVPRRVELPAGTTTEQCVADIRDLGDDEDRHRHLAPMDGPALDQPRCIPLSFAV